MSVCLSCSSFISTINSLDNDSDHLSNSQMQKHNLNSSFDREVQLWHLHHPSEEKQSEGIIFS